MLRSMPTRRPRAVLSKLKGAIGDGIPPAFSPGQLQTGPWCFSSSQPDEGHSHLHPSPYVASFWARSICE